ncbi:MAG: hypothetical protein UX13_C0051G0008 [Candidatus Woesebacteria bacterium GW2011_GWB1_45_5]|uniref:Fimbrial assembly family protein n=1 Tax=Candidatus Woesebacteria bacterium GW2011_GWB1_45_5 TaxID=1618581 RepID=A0A0G1PU75_9BACT|nr:MAG: hypothetical protein UX13_C0051G0008 [Candidatus Woesebacteria bacterium GW2011_GWB1_45_5]
MAVKLNLLPPEYSVSKGLNRLLKATRMLGVIGLGIFLVFVLGMGAFFIFSSLTLRELSSENEALKTQITARSTSEQQLVLIKDRIKKVRTVRGISSSLPNLNNFETLSTSLGAGIDLTEVAVDSQKIDLSVRMDSNSELTSFVGTLTGLATQAGTKIFKSVVLTSFGFNPVGGYVANIRIE